ncbi:MAG: hypothetical protein ABIN91_11275 [Mucilaginibacter sp.]
MTELLNKLNQMKQEAYARNPCLQLQTPPDVIGYCFLRFVKEFWVPGW